jgi:hypothetical protein
MEDYYKIILLMKNLHRWLILYIKLKELLDKKLKKELNYKKK